MKPAISRKQPQPALPVSRKRQLKRLEIENGLEYAIIRNNQIQIGNAARDFLKEFADYIGSDGVASSSKKVRLNPDGTEKKGNGGVYIQVSKQINRLLNIGSIKAADLVADQQLLSKIQLCWSLVIPTLSTHAEKNLPRRECFAALWEKFQQVSDI